MKYSTKPRLNILYIASRIPSHLSTGDRLRTYMLIRGLVDRGHNVDLLGFENMLSPRLDTDIYHLVRTARPVHHADIEFQAYARSQQIRDTLVGLLNGFPRRVWQFHSPMMIRTLQEMLQSTTYNVIQLSEIGVAGLLPYLDQVHTVKVFDLMDAVSMSVRNSLRYRLDLSWPSRLLEAVHLRWFERRVLDDVDAASVVSSEDRTFLSSSPRLRVIPIGLDMPKDIVPTMRDLDVMFVGNMSARPNIDALNWFMRMVWPTILDQRPDTTLHIVGRDPSAAIRRLAGDRVVVTGAVADVGTYLDRAKVCVAPLRFGAGQKIKLLEAFAHAVPVVATTAANEGINAEHDIGIVICDDPQAMANAVLDLLRDSARRAKIGQQAQRFMQARFTWHHSTDLLEDLYYEVLHNAYPHAPSPHADRRG